MQEFRRMPFRWFAVCICISFLSLISRAAVPAIRQPIDDSTLVSLGGNVHPAAQVQYDRGAAGVSVPARRLLLTLKRSAAQEADLQQFLAELHDKNSSSYHKWLTPEQYGARFGASDEDLQTLTAWLEGHGFTVNQVNAARTSLEFSGNVGQLQRTFHTAIHRFVVGGQEHLANVSDPEIPAALAPVVAGIVGMNDFFPAAEHTVPVHAVYDKATQFAHSESTTAAGGNLLYVGPRDAATIYDTPNSFNANFKGTRAYTGAKVTIGVVSDANINTADVDSYRSFFGLPANTPKVIIDGGTDPGVDPSPTGHTQQALLDVEVAGALAPNANVILYTAQNTPLTSGIDLAILRALNDNLVDVLQVGFSTCEAALTAAKNQTISTWWGNAVAQGITVVVAAGDAGPAGCDLGTGATAAQNGLRVNGYASTPFNVAIGGTDVDTLPANFGQYVGSGGFATQYIPESPWNDSVATGQNASLTNNTPFEDNAGATNITAGGGGASSCVNPAVGTNGRVTCNPISSKTTLTGTVKPTWQSYASNLNVPDDGVRDVPDVAFLAGSGRYGASWAVCGNDYDAAGNSVVDCARGSGSGATIQGIGGTSGAASAFAGILALISESQSVVNPAQGTRLGQANYVLYSLANVPVFYGAVFHDIKSGNNSVICASGSPNCGPNDFLTGYDAVANYDQATGLGSVDATALITNWSKAVFAPTVTGLTITLANGKPLPPSIPHGTSLKFTIKVTGNATDGIPTGLVAGVANVDEQDGTYGDDFGFTLLLSPTATATAISGQAPGGKYDVFGRYEGNLLYAASTSAPVPLNIETENSSLKLSLYLTGTNGSQVVTAPNPSYPYGSSLSVDAVVNGSSGQGKATGTVTFEDKLAPLSTPADNLNNNGVAVFASSAWAVGSHSVTGKYSGDNSFNASASQPPALTFTISAATSGLTMSATPASLISGVATVTGSVTSSTAGRGAAAPTGTITLTDSTNGAVLGTATLIATKGSPSATFTFSVNASQLALGANTLTAAYPGDTNYRGASGTASVTRLALISTALTVAANPASLSSGTTSLTGQIAPSANTAATAPTGTVTLTDSTNGAALGTATVTAGTNSTAGSPLGTFTFTVNASSLASGANTLTATYAGDANYSGASGTAVVTLTVIPPQISEFEITTTAVMIGTPGQKTADTSLITITPINGFTGQVNLSTALVSSPANALGLPTVTLSAPSVTISGTTPATATAAINTSALTYSSKHASADAPSKQTPLNKGWYSGGGAVLACLVFLGIPGRRRSWRAMLGLLLFAAVGLSIGCGVSLNPVATVATTPGTYVFSITGTDQATGKITVTGTITVTVQ